MTRLLLVRHGETAWNAARRLQGQEGIALSARGQRQAAGLTALVHTSAPGQVVASDLTRTLETSTALSYTPEADPRWREANLGTLTGRHIEMLRQEAPDAYAGWRGGSFTPPGAESFDALRGRVLEATKDLPGTARTVLIVTHGGPIRALCAHLLCLPPKRVVPVSPGSLTVLELPAAEHATFEPGSAKLHTFNWRPHGALLDAPD